ncbi:MAG: PspC domain-containing protein [Bacteroidales bacterium]|nr:PspC domain-containing protein [Bacteroidales bacterium]
MKDLNIEKMKKRLTKSLSDRKLFGICGGIAQYLDVDSTFIRVIYVVLSFCTAIIPSIILYVVLNFIIPEA